MNRPGIDLHTHSAVSDGTDTPTALVERAARLGLSVVALTDHDTVDGLPEAQAAAGRVGIALVPGLELSTSFTGRSVHLLAYGADATEPAFAAELVKIRAGRSDRLTPVLAKLAELGVGVSEAEVLAQVGDSPSVGRPHIADALVAAGHVKDRREAFDRFLADNGPAHVERYAVDLVRGLALVRGAGGVAVIAHPWGRATREVLTPELIAELATRHGLDGIEVDHQDHDPAERAELRGLAAELGLLGTGSSDYHGTGKIDHELGCNTTDPEVYERLVGLLAARRSVR